MRRTFALVSVAVASLAAAAVAALIRPAQHKPGKSTGPLHMTTQLDRRYVPGEGGEAFLQIDLAADGDGALRHRVPVNAVLILDRSGSLTGAKMARARDASLALTHSHCGTTS